MNIFALDYNPLKAAQYHTDKHVVKMILETSQMLSTAHHVLDGSNASPKLYKAAYVNHPCTKWVRESHANYRWALQLLFGLHKEYHLRYLRQHKSMEIFDELSKLPINIPYGPLTPFAQAMPDQYKHEDGVTAYRQYYLGEKHTMFKWTWRGTPQFVTQYLTEGGK